MPGSGTDPAVHLYPCWDNAPGSPQRGLRTPAGEGLTVSELSLSTEEITLFFGMFSFSKLKARPAMGLLCLLPCILSTLGLGTHRWRSAQAGHFCVIHTGLFQNIEPFSSLFCSGEVGMEGGVGGLYCSCAFWGEGEL